MTELLKRQGLSREIAYRPHVRLTYYLGCLITLLAALPFIKALFSPGFLTQPVAFVSAFIIFNLLTLGCLSIAVFFLRRLAYTKFQVLPDRIEIFFNNRQLAAIDFAQVESIHFEHIPLLLEMFTVTVKNKGNFIFTMAIERSEYILDALYNARPEIFAMEKLKEYRLAAVVVDHAAHRLEKRVRNKKWLAVKYLLYPGWIAAAVAGVQLARSHPLTFSHFLSMWGISMGLHFVLGLLVYGIFEFFTVRQERKKLRQNPNDLRVDLALEKVSQARSQRLYYFSSIVFLILYVVVLN